MGYGDTSSLIEFLANNYNTPAARVQAVYIVLDATPAAVMTLKRSNVSKPQDLVGKTLGAPIFDAGRKLWPLFARAQGIDPSAVKWQSMEPALREQMLVRGQVDGVTGFQPSGLISAVALGAKEDELTVFYYKDYGIKVYGNAIIANPKFIQDNPKAISAFLRAFNRSLKETIANPEEALKTVKEREPLIDSAVELRRLKGLLDQFVVTPNVKAEGLSAVTKARLDAQVDDVVRVFGLGLSPDAALIFNPSFLPERSALRL